MASINIVNPQAIKCIWHNRLPEGTNIVKLINIDLCKSDKGNQYWRAELAETKTKHFYVFVESSKARELTEFLGKDVLITKELDKIKGFVSSSGREFNTYKYFIEKL